MKRKRNRRSEKEPLVCGYDYSTKEMREETADTLFRRAKNARGAVERDWERYNDYYNFIHDVTGELDDYLIG